MNDIDKESKLLEYCVRLFEAMSPNATEQEGVLVWQGRLLEMAAGLGISRGNYSRAIAKLREMGCVEQISRGFRGTHLSTYALIQPPTPEAFVKSSDATLTSRPTYDSLVARVKELERQIGGLNIVEVLATHDGQIKELQTALQLQGEQ